MPETIFFLFSAHSQACKQLFPTIQTLSKHLTILPVDIDHIDIRHKVRLTDIKTVPCIVVQTEEKLMVLENHELANFIHRTIGLIQASQSLQPEQSAQPQQSAQHTTLVKPEDVTKPVADMSFVSSINSRLQPIEFAPPADSTEPAPTFDSMMIGEDDTPTPAFQKQGYSKHDILGGSSAESPKELKMEGVKAASESMMREREEAEKSTRRGV